ncbi:hypothetical protein WJX75_006375 [Coccomyxa subellipsoidea]|uniref:Uncharacterized protein n=1 Tax=Coccomyxa subellipsoidea TaxID=248742 RepID=A0ABR2YN20_9CHLO
MAQRTTFLDSLSLPCATLYDKDVRAGLVARGLSLFRWPALSCAICTPWSRPVADGRQAAGACWPLGQAEALKLF